LQQIIRYLQSRVQHGLLLQNSMLVLGWMTSFKLAWIKWNLESVSVNLPPAPFIIRSHTFCPLYPLPPILLLYPRENGEFGGTGREWRYHSDVSVRPSTSQYGINIATTGVRCSFQHHCYVAPCISCLSLLLPIDFHICVCKTGHQQCQATRLMETLLKTAYFVLELILGLFYVFNNWDYIEWWDHGGTVVKMLCYKS